MIRALDSSPKILLEIGSGEGSNLRYLSSRLPETLLIGMDFAGEKIAFQKKHVASSEGVVGDACRLPFHDETIDVILCRDLLHHIPSSPAASMNEFRRILRSGGKIIVLESNGRTFLNGIFQLLFPVERKMRFSTPARLLPAFRSFFQVNIEFVEASFLLRALSFVLGWRDGFERLVLSPLYFLAEMWEWAARQAYPRDQWTYMMFVAEK